MVPPDPTIDLIGFCLYLCCFIPLALFGLMLIGIFAILVLNMFFGRKP